MHVLSRSPILAGLLLLAGNPLYAFAETPLVDPVPPAVIGRPLEQIRPVRPVAKKPVAKPVRPALAKANKAPTVRRTATAAAAGGAAAAGARPAKQALDDRADPRMRSDDIGKGTRLARKPLAPGAYFADRHRAAVRKFYASQPAPAKTTNWQIGEPVPAGAPVAAVPKGLMASLPPLPPGHQYVQLGGEVVLIAAGSKMVVDGISRSPS